MVVKPQSLWINIIMINHQKMSEVSFVCSPRGKPFLLWLCNYERWGQRLQEYPDSVIAHDVALNQSMFYCFQWNAQPPNVPGFFSGRTFLEVGSKPEGNTFTWYPKEKKQRCGIVRGTWIVFDSLSLSIWNCTCYNTINTWFYTVGCEIMLDT